MFSRPTQSELQKVLSDEESTTYTLSSKTVGVTSDGDYADLFIYSLH
mgnify:CR=1 FL=1